MHPHRVKLMRETFRRLKVSCATAELHDARFGDRRSFRFALVDAPCSGLGVAWDSPDIKVSRRPEDVTGLAETQLKILRTVSELVEVGGRLLYSTCTISRAENEDVAAQFLRRERGFRPCNLSEYLPDALKTSTDGHTLQLLPTVHGTEGFFLALFQRVK
jgi:16S rRNA (cytosine967-C5)-methyltransferase